jgi:phasin family protein
MTKPPQFEDSLKASVETSIALATKTLEGVQQLSALNLELGRSLLGEAAERVKAAMAARTPEDLLGLQAAALQAIPAQTTLYLRQVRAIVAGLSDAYRTAAEAKAAELQALFLEALSGALMDLPGKAEALELTRSAIATAKNAYDTANEATHRFADVATEKFAARA